MTTRRRTRPIPGPDGLVELAPRLHLARWTVGAIAVLVVAWAISVVLLNDRIRWDQVGAYLLDPRVVQGVGETVWISLVATALGLVLGVVVAIMKISKNPVLKAIADGYLWLFRGTPVLVQLIFWYNLAFLLPYLTLAIPFTQIGLRWDTNEVISGATAAILGLGLNLSAYFAETVRAGILAVDSGQAEAAQAGGMTRAQTMRLIILPQALRIIIPPTGNEFISMLKTTSLIIVVAGHDLMSNVSKIYKQNNLIIELLIVASVWYMLLTAIATYLQSLLERRFGEERVRLVRGPTWAQKLVQATTGSIRLQTADAGKVPRA